MSERRFDAARITAFATDLLSHAGLETEKARAVAEVLIEGDLMGHTTHGVQLLAPYLGEIEAGRMACEGDPETVQARGAVVTWDGRRLPGPWLVRKAIDVASGCAATYGQGTVVIRRSHHIASLASYLKPVTDKGLVIEIATSDPSGGSVAPYGGLKPLYTPNPVAAGFPTDGDPILLDVSMSITTNGLTNRLHKEAQKLAHPWIQDNAGKLSRDPAVLFTDPPGSILPMGGKDHGHKGYALGLLVEALTSGLGGFGRADEGHQWGANVFVQIIDPEAFGGLEAFRRETGWLAKACRDNPVPEGCGPVRLPGARGLALRRQQMADGISFHPGIIDSLAPWSEKFGIPTPDPL